MGTIISLDVGGIEIGWCKNSRGIDHGMLFQEQDRKSTRSDQIDYEYFKENDEDPGKMEMAFCRPLKEVIPRLELLGFTLEQVRKEYEASTVAWIENYEEIKEEGEPELDLMSFQEFCSFVNERPLGDLDKTFVSDIGDKGKSQIQGRFNDEAIKRRLPHYDYYDDHAYSEHSYFGSLLGFLHPYTQLRLLGENDNNLNENVVWQYGPLVHSGWEDESAFIPDARRTQAFLIVTEGSSDTHILKHAFQLLRPGITDFFRFMDVSERHPFSGTGNLLKFTEGLIKIDVQNQVVILFDNDAEGFETYKKALTMNLPSNMRAMILPQLDEFESFNAFGPEGEGQANINQRAAAIECYLDLRLNDYPPARIVWTNYKKDLGIYQGSLEHKDSYTKKFMKLTRQSLSADDYDIVKLEKLLNSLISECVEMAVGMRKSAN